MNGYLFPFDVKRDGTARMAEWMRRERITIWNSVATTFRQLLESVTDPVGFPDLRSVLIGGETIHRRDVELFQRHCSPDCVLTINYGITETAGAICQNHIEQQSTIDDAVEPVGYPVAERKLLLLDDARREVPPGQVGEIAVQSRYLAVGYWNRPDLTERAFLRDAASGSERIYLTGDLGILAPDGCLTHLGRKDARVKIRGHFVDPAETERLLVSLPTVRDAAVVARTDRHGQTILAAYLVPTQWPGPSATEWRSALAEQLPAHMIPDAFVKLDALPRTLGNKVDRTALPEPGTQRPDLENAYQGPRTPLEELLVRLWEDVLEISPIGVDDDFFDLGGNSLQAMQFIDRLRDELNAYLYIIGVFDAPTIAQFAEYLQADYRDSLIKRFGPNLGYEAEATNPCARKPTVAKAA